MTARAGSEPKLLLPGLSDFYASVADLWYPMIRFVAGAFLLYHGVGKLLGGAGPVIAAMAKYHIEPSVPAAYVVIFLETVGALCVALGLFTRFLPPALPSRWPSLLSSRKRHWALVRWSCSCCGAP